MLPIARRRAAARERVAVDRDRAVARADQRHRHRHDLAAAGMAGVEARAAGDARAWRCRRRSRRSCRRSPRRGWRSCCRRRPCSTVPASVAVSTGATRYRKPSPLPSTGVTPIGGVVLLEVGDQAAARVGGRVGRSRRARRPQPGTSAAAPALLTKLPPEASVSVGPAKVLLLVSGAARVMSAPLPETIASGLAKTKPVRHGRRAGGRAAEGQQSGRCPSRGCRAGVAQRQGCPPRPCRRPASCRRCRAGSSGRWRC